VTATTPSSIAAAYVDEPAAPKTDPTALVAPDADARVRRARLGGGEPAWSEEALFAMGVPKVICDAGISLDDLRRRTLDSLPDAAA